MLIGVYNNVIFFVIECEDVLKHELHARNIDIISLQNSFTLLCHHLYPNKHHKTVKLIFKKDLNNKESYYLYGTETFHIHCIPERSILIEHLLHEFRHWIQAIIQKKSVKMIDYDADDPNLTVYSKKYWHNPLEVDARRFVIKHRKRFMQYMDYFSAKD